MSSFKFLPAAPASCRPRVTYLWGIGPACACLHQQQTDYCNSLLAGVSDQLIGQLQSVLRTAARLVLQKKKYDHISGDIRNKLHWLPIRQRISFKLCSLVFRCLHGESPPYLTECFLSFQAVMRCGLIARRLVMISLFHGLSPKPSALVGLRSLGRLHGTHSQHAWKIKICLLSSDHNSIKPHFF